MNQNQKQQNQEQKLPEQKDRDQKLTFWQTMGSVIAASFGVQSQKNKERDFEKGSIPGFIAAALIFTAVFVVTLVVVVRLVLP
jgi:hypothetical protein